MTLNSLTINGKTYDKFPTDRTKGLIFPAEITGNAASTVKVPASLISLPFSGYTPGNGDMLLTVDNCLYKITGFSMGEEMEYTGKMIRYVHSGSSPNGSGVYVGPEPPADTTMLWVDTSDETEDELPPAGEKYVLPAATADNLGGIKADPATDADTQPVRIGGDGKLYTAPGGGGSDEGGTLAPSADDWDIHYKTNIAEALENGFEITEVDGKPLQLKELWALVKLQSAVDSAWLGCEILTDNPSVQTSGSSSMVGGVNVNANGYAYFTYHAIILPESNRFIVDVSCGKSRGEALRRITNDHWLNNWLEYNPVNYFTGIKCNNNLGAGTSQGYGTEIELWGKTK